MIIRGKRNVKLRMNESARYTFAYITVNMVVVNMAKIITLKEL
jgi:hypothetical protein